MTTKIEVAEKPVTLPKGARWARLCSGGPASLSWDEVLGQENFTYTQRRVEEGLWDEVYSQVVRADHLVVLEVSTERERPLPDAPTPPLPVEPGAEQAVRDPVAEPLLGVEIVEEVGGPVRPDGGGVVEGHPQGG